MYKLKKLNVEKQVETKQAAELLLAKGYTLIKEPEPPATELDVETKEPEPPATEPEAKKRK